MHMLQVDYLNLQFVATNVVSYITYESGIDSIHAPICLLDKEICLWHILLYKQLYKQLQLDLLLYELVLFCC